MIDKSLRSKYAWGGPGGKSPGTSASGGSRNGGASHDRGGGQHRAAAQRAAPVTTAKAPPSILSRDTKPEPKDDPIIRHHTVDTPVQKLEQKILDQLQAKEKEKFDADWEFEDKKVVKIPDIKPKIVETPERGVPWLEDELVKTVTPQKISPTYYQDRSRIGGETYGERVEAAIPRGGVGTTLKNIALGIVAPQLLAGTSLAKPYQMYRQYETAKKYIPKIGEFETALRSNLRTPSDIVKGRRFDPKDPIGWTGEQKRKKTFHEPRDGEATIAKQVAGGEDVVTKTANQFAGTEVEGQIQSLVQNNLNLALRHYADMYSRIEKGYSPNRQEMDVFKLLEHYLNQAAPKPQGAAYGGRIDKALGGRSRDIG